MNNRDQFSEADRHRIRRGWYAHLAEADAWELAEDRSAVLRAAWWRRWVHEMEWKLRAAVKRLEMGDASLLAEVLIEALEIAEAEKI